MLDKLIEAITYIMTALSNCTLYSQDHPAVLYLAEKAVRTMDDLYVDDTINLTILGDSLIFNDTPIIEESTHMSTFIKKVRRKGIEKIVIKKGLTPEELKVFITEMAFADTISTDYFHISAGTVEVRLKAEGTPVRALIDHNISQVKDIHTRLSRFRQLDTGGLEEIVISFISTLKRESNVLKVVSPFKSHSEYTYTHTTNVSILSVFQAEALGLKGDALHEIGLAGLLHDIGKMFVPKKILEKKDRLSETEWNQIKRHPVYGALYLSTRPDIPKLTAIATYEHHMKFNGTGYPETKRRSKKQHIASQIIAIADFFDALRSHRPYRKKLDVPEISSLLLQGAGSDFNPVLVENFLFALNKITPAF